MLNGLLKQWYKAYWGDAELTWQNVRLGHREWTRIECGLRMVQQVRAIQPTFEQTRQLTCKLPAIYVAFRLKRLVQRHFDEAMLIHTLTWGVQNAPAAMSCAGCLGGLFLYFRNLRSSKPLVLERALQSFERELRRLRGQDESLFGEVKSARRRAQGIRRNHLELPVPTADKFRAARIEGGDEVRYVIERREDGELSIDIPHLSLRGRTLFLEYSVLDPRDSDGECTGPHRRHRAHGICGGDVPGSGGASHVFRSGLAADTLSSPLSDGSQCSATFCSPLEHDVGQCSGETEARDEHRQVDPDERRAARSQEGRQLRVTGAS